MFSRSFYTSLVYGSDWENSQLNYRVHHICKDENALDQCHFKDGKDVPLENISSSQRYKHNVNECSRRDLTKLKSAVCSVKACQNGEDPNADTVWEAAENPKSRIQKHA